VAEGLPDALTHWLSHVASFGFVVTTWTAKFVVGLNDGLPFSALVRFSVVAVPPVSVGVPGVLADVYVDETLEAVPVFSSPSLAVTV
jgi:hypothetical protein